MSMLYRTQELSLCFDLHYHCVNECYGKRLFAHEKQFNYRRYIKILRKKSPMEKYNIIHIRVKQLQRSNVSINYCVC